MATFYDVGERKAVIQCSVGCLRHVIGVTYFKFRPGDSDEPELYFETLHEPYEPLWGRLKAAWRFVVKREPIGVDSTLVSAAEARKLIDVLFNYANEWKKWDEHMNSLPKQDPSP